MKKKTLDQFKKLDDIFLVKGGMHTVREKTKCSTTSVNVADCKDGGGGDKDEDCIFAIDSVDVIDMAKINFEIYGENSFIETENFITQNL